MATFPIKDAATNEPKVTGLPRYNGAYCKVSYLEFPEINWPTPIDWKVGDYVEYDRMGMTYRLFDIPQPKKRARSGDYGGAFVYSNVQFFPDTKWLEIEPFRDLVPADNTVHFTTQSSWSVWTNVADLIGRFNAVMQAAHPGMFRFELVNAAQGTELYSILHDKYFNFTISGESVLDGLNKLYDLCENIGWVHSVETHATTGEINVITVGIPPAYIEGIGEITEAYSYGVGNGLTEIRKSITNRNELKTRLFAYGSTRNMITGYYNKLTPAIKDADSVYIPNLMLPVDLWGKTEEDGVQRSDASKAFLDSDNISELGVRPTTAYFDGTDGNMEIFPSLEYATVEELQSFMDPDDPYYPTGLASMRLDEILQATPLEDNGVLNYDGNRYGNKVVGDHAEETETVEIAAGSSNEVEFSGGTFTGVEYTSKGAISYVPSFGGSVSETGNAIKSVTVRTVFTLGLTRTDFVAVGESRVFAQKVNGVWKFDVPSVNVFAADDSYPNPTVGVQVFVTIATREDADASTATVVLESGSAIIGQIKSFPKTFFVSVPQIGFNIMERAALAASDYATISFKTGECGGREFKIKNAVFNDTLNIWQLEIWRGLDESLVTYFPNSDYQIASGDKYVLLDIAMPDTYVRMAEERLYGMAERLLADISSPKAFYEPVIDAQFMIAEGRTLMEGIYMTIVDEDIINGSEHVLIDTLTITENAQSIPTYRVTLREQKRLQYTESQQTGGSLVSLANGTTSGGTQSSSGGGGLSPEQETIIANMNSWFGIDEQGNIFVKRDGNNLPRNFYSFGNVSAGGLGVTGGVANAIVLSVGNDPEEVSYFTQRYTVTNTSEEMMGFAMRLLENPGTPVVAIIPAVGIVYFQIFTLGIYTYGMSMTTPIYGAFRLIWAVASASIVTDTRIIHDYNEQRGFASEDDGATFRGITTAQAKALYDLEDPTTAVVGAPVHITGTATNIHALVTAAEMVNGKLKMIFGDHYIQIDSQGTITFDS